jgi:hypothetical protein
MVDPQQIQLVNTLEQQATQAEQERDLAKDHLDIAIYRSQQPNVYRWRQHGAAWLFAGIVGTSGTLYALEKQAPYVIPFATGAGLGVGLFSNTVDKRKQTSTKQDRLELCRHELAEAEQHLRQTVTLYREEEETAWLMYALDTSKEKLLALRTWMSDPRRTMKDSVLESIDIVNAQFFNRPLENQLSPFLTTERNYRAVRKQLFDEAIALKKDEFLAHVFAKHHFLREQELQAAGLQSNLFINGTAVGVGSAAGLLAGASMAALGSKAAAIGSSKMAIAHAITGTTSVVAVLGAGLLAAGKIHHWMSKADSQRRAREAQQFQDAFALTTQVLEAVMLAQSTNDIAERRTHLQNAYDGVTTLKRETSKAQDAQMKQTVELLGDRLERALKSVSKQQPPNRKLRLNLFSIRN